MLNLWDRFSGWAADLTWWQLVMFLVAAALVLLVGSWWFTRAAVRRGLRTPWAIHKINELRDRLVGLVKRPITIMVLDEVVDVIKTGHYTRNIADALEENRRELAALVTEKLRHERNLRLVGKLPGYNTVVSEVAETTLRVVIDMLGDPRMDELVADLLRNNLEQIRIAVRERQHEQLPTHIPPDLPTYTGPFSGPTSGPTSGPIRYR